MATLTTSNNPVDGTRFIVAGEVMHKYMGMVVVVGGTEAFKDRHGTASFFRAHWTDRDKAAASVASGHMS